ncbi:MAG: NAD-dependent epimerase/dehydratase [Polaromonas sp.]|nr:NAD-dependent epimerase/dehydratase [Polaromonas sp.]
MFIALGTTLKLAGSRQAFRALDLDAVVALARAGRAAGATRLGVVSAMGADSRSPVFYNRVKGEMEAAVGALGFETLVIARPSLLAGDRASLSQPARPAERWAQRVLAFFHPLVPAHYRPVQADAVAGALVNRLQTAGPGRHVVLSDNLRLYSENL